MRRRISIPAEIVEVYFRDGTLAYLVRLLDGTEILLDRRCIDMESAAVQSDG